MNDGSMVSLCKKGGGSATTFLQENDHFLFYNYFMSHRYSFVCC